MPQSAIVQNPSERPVAGFSLLGNYRLAQSGHVRRTFMAKLYDEAGHGRLGDNMEPAQFQSGAWLSALNLDPSMASSLHRAVLAVVVETEAIEARLLAELMGALAAGALGVMRAHSLEAALNLDFLLLPPPAMLYRTILRLLGDSGELGQLRVWRYETETTGPNFSTESKPKTTDAREMTNLLNDRDGLVEASLAGLPGLFAAVLVDPVPTRQFNTDPSIWYRWSDDETAIYSPPSIRKGRSGAAGQGVP